MKVQVAADAGFCFGVKRAIDLALQAAGADRIWSLGPLIHNPREIARLSAWVCSVESLEDIGEAGARVVVRSHGVGPDIYEQAANLGLELIDATCPFVQKAQRAAAELYQAGRQVVLVGDHNHPEVIGIKAWTAGSAWVVANAVEASALPQLPENAVGVGVVAQTTQTEANLAQVLAVLRSKYDQVCFQDTICRATRKRQEAARALAAKVDLMVVIGGQNSANTKKLVQICQECGVPALLVEGADELPADLFDGIMSVGVCAGASTPDWIIEEVVVKMSEQMEQNQVTEQKVQEAKEPEVKRNFAAEMSFVPSRTPATGGSAAKASAPVAEDNKPEEPSLDQMGDDVSFEEYYKHGIKDIYPGLRVQGTVVQVRDTEMLVDIGGKSEGILPSNQLLAEEAENIREKFHVGDKFDVVVLRKENKEGYPVVSKRKVDVIQIWDKLAQAKEEGAVVSGKVIDAVKGGVLMDVGVRGFVPYSQLDTHFVEDVKAYLGQELSAKVIECDKDNNRLLLSPKQLKLEELKKMQDSLWEEIEVGQVRKGTVSRLTSFGAFVDLGGVDGLLHVSQMAWYRINQPSDVLKEGDEIEVYVLNADPEKKKISLSLKQLIPNPWTLAAEKYPVGAVVSATIMRLAPFGAFAQLEPGVEGLIHISQLAKGRVEKTEDVVAPGQVVEVKVLSVDADNKRLSLSIKELLQDDEVPAEAAAEETAVDKAAPAE